MPGHTQVLRQTATGQKPAVNTRTPGELYVNIPDLNLGFIDQGRASLNLLPIRYHSASANYATGDFVVQAGGLYQAKFAITAGAFNVNSWNLIQPTATLDTRYVQLSGSIMSGLLTLSGAPTSNLHAATKLYTDTQDALKLNLTGGTLTGALNLPSAMPTVATQAAHKSYVDTQDALKLNLTGGTLTGALTLSGNPASANQAANKAYVDTAVSALSSYLPLSGGTLTGNIAAPVFVIASSGGYIQSTATATQFVMDTNLWRWDYTRSSGAMQYTRGSDNLALLSIDPNGAVAAATSFSAPTVTGSSYIIGGNVYARGGMVYFGTGDTAYLQSDGTNCKLQFRSDGYNFYWNGNTGDLSFNTPTNTLFSVDGNGNGNFLGGVTVGGNGVSYTVEGSSTRAIAFGWDGYGVGMTVDSLNQGYAIRSSSGGGLTGVWQIALNGSVSQVYGYYGTGTIVQWTYSPSDARLKTNIAPPTLDALDVINQLIVHQFDMTVPIPGAVEQHWDFGLIAQEIGDVLPIARVPATVEGTYEMIRELPLIATLVRAVQQLDQRVRELEGP